MCMLSHTAKALHLFRRSKRCLVVTTILNKQTIRNKTKTNNNMFPAWWSTCALESSGKATANGYIWWWMGHLGPVSWPARSPYLNPLYYFLWGHLTTLVYATPLDHVDDLLPRIVDGCNTIRTTPGLLERVRQSMLLRCQRHFEDLL